MKPVVAESSVNSKGQSPARSILSVESNQNVESKTKNVQSKTEKYGVQNSIWSVDSQENH